MSKTISTLQFAFAIIWHNCGRVSERYVASERATKIKQDTFAKILLSSTCLRQLPFVDEEGIAVANARRVGIMDHIVKTDEGVVFLSEKIPEVIEIGVLVIIRIKIAFRED